MKTLQNAVCLTLMLAMLGNAVADEKKGKGKKADAKKPTATQRLVGKMELSDEQKEKIAAVDKQFAERFDAINKAMADILTDEQKKAQRTAQKEAKDSGKTGADARKAIEAALNLTEEQKAKRQEHQKAQAKLTAEIVAALKPILTAEQQEKLPKTPAKAAGGDKPKKKKKDAA
ncbi:MAG: hypothetical protein R3C49_07650 [Planctomycetaceae bacterium]